MSIDVLGEVHVRRPREQVAAYMSDPANDPEWIGGLREARLLGDGPLREGSQVARVASFLGRRVKAPFPMNITHTFEDGDGGTVVRNHVKGGGGLFSLGSPWFAPLVRRNVQKDLERLRDVLEAR
jgi:carbon monoxide dehydrogenase subunit G